MTKVNCIEVVVALKEAYCHRSANEFDRLCQLYLSEFEKEDGWQLATDEVIGFLEETMRIVYESPSAEVISHNMLKQAKIADKILRIL